MIVISKDEAKMIRKMFPRAHMVKTVHKTMVDEIPDILKALPNNINAQRALQEIESWDKNQVYNTREEMIYE